MIPAPTENIMGAKNHEEHDEDKHETTSQKSRETGCHLAEIRNPSANTISSFSVSLRLRLRQRLWFQLQGPIRQAEVPKAAEMSKLNHMICFIK